jgi:drug/metabolite transporter (DMT)-like permease
MIRNPKTRRALSAALMVIGGVLIFLAPEDIGVGVLLLALGLVLEVVGTLMHRQSGD